MGKCYFKAEWLKNPEYSDWLVEHIGDKNLFKCKLCAQSYKIGQSGTKALTSHMSAKKHISAMASMSATKSILDAFSIESSANDQPRTLSSKSTEPVSSPALTQQTLKVVDDSVLRAEVM